MTILEILLLPVYIVLLGIITIVGLYVAIILFGILIYIFAIILGLVLMIIASIFSSVVWVCEGIKSLWGRIFHRCEKF